MARRFSAYGPHVVPWRGSKWQVRICCSRYFLNTFGDSAVGVGKRWLLPVDCRADALGEEQAEAGGVSARRALPSNKGCRARVTISAPMYLSSAG